MASVFLFSLWTETLSCGDRISFNILRLALELRVDIETIFIRLARVLVLAVAELILFTVVRLVLCFVFVMKNSVDNTLVL